MLDRESAAKKEQEAEAARLETQSVARQAIIAEELHPASKKKKKEGTKGANTRAHQKEE